MSTLSLLSSPSVSDTDIDTLAKTKSHTIKVPDSYTVEAGDTLVLKGNLGFKLQPKDDVPVTLTIDGAVEMDSAKHLRLAAIGATRGPNTEVTIALGETGSIAVTNDAAGVTQTAAAAVQAATLNFTNDGEIHVASSSAGGATTLGGYLFAADAHIANNGVMEVQGSSNIVGGIYVNASHSLDLVNTGSIEANGSKTVMGIIATGLTGGSLRNDGEINASGALVYGVNAMGAIDVVTNNGDITVNYVSPGGFSPGGGAAGMVSSGVSFGGPNSAMVENTGHIHANGGSGVSLGVGVAGGIGFHNSGEIVATSDGTAAGVPFHSAGVEIGLNPGAVMVNDGSITGEYAIISLDLTVSGTSGGGLASDEIVINNGSLEGMVNLGRGDDSFDSHVGTLDGDVYGGVGDDTLIGSAGSDVLHGDGQDTTAGADGADDITGGRGADTLTGGDSGDVFRFVKATDSDATGADLITDLTNADQIDLHGVDADATTAGNQAFVLVGAFGGHARELVVSYDAGTGLTTIAGDTDGDGTADLVITASGDHHDFTNFVL